MLRSAHRTGHLLRRARTRLLVPLRATTSAPLGVGDAGEGGLPFTAPPSARSGRSAEAERLGHGAWRRAPALALAADPRP